MYCFPSSETHIRGSRKWTHPVRCSSCDGDESTESHRKVELPLAMPVIMVGIRTATVLIIGTATIVTYIGAGGLGNIIL